MVGDRWRRLLDDAQTLKVVVKLEIGRLAPTLPGVWT